MVLCQGYLCRGRANPAGIWFDHPFALPAGHDNAGFFMIKTQVVSCFSRQGPCLVVYIANFVDESDHHRRSANGATQWDCPEGKLYQMPFTVTSKDQVILKGKLSPENSLELVVQKKEELVSSF